MKKGELQHIHVSPNDDGSVQVILHKKAKEGRVNKGPWLSDHSEEKLGAKDHKEASAHVAKALAEHFGGGSAKSTPTPGVKSGKSAAAKVSRPLSDESDEGSESEYA